MVGLSEDTHLNKMRKKVCSNAEYGKVITKKNKTTTGLPKGSRRSKDFSGRQKRVSRRYSMGTKMACFGG